MDNSNSQINFNNTYNQPPNNGGFAPNTYYNQNQNQTYNMNANTSHPAYGGKSQNMYSNFNV